MATIATRVEWAYGADLSADPASWTWTDESTYSLGSVHAEWGAQDEGSQTQPTLVRLRLRNTDYRFSPRHASGVHYPYVRQWTPIRISLNPGTGMVERFVVFADEIRPVWPSGNEGYAEVEVTARGRLTQLGQGSEPFRSALRRSYDNDATPPVAYWPLEGGADSPTAYDVIAGIPSVVGGFAGTVGSAGAPKFGATSIGPGSGPVASIAGGWNLDLNMPASVAATGTVAYQWTTTFGTTVRSGTYTTCGIRQSPAFAARHLAWNVYAHDTGLVELKVVEADVSFATLAGPTLLLAHAGPQNMFDGLPRLYQLNLVASGGTNVVWTLYQNDELLGTGTHTPSFAGAMNAAPFRAAGFSTADASAVAALGHVGVYTHDLAADRYAALTGHVGELATDRMARLGAEESVPVAVTGVSAALMGPQGTGTLVAQWRECEQVDGGLLYDGFAAGVQYITADGRCSLAATVALDVDRQQVKLPFQPVENSQRRRNKWTVSRLNGGLSETFVDDAAVTADGGVTLPDSATLNVATDAVLLDEAAWRTNLSTVDEMRVPGIVLQLIDRPELWTPWLTMRPGLRMTAIHLPAQYPPGMLDMALEGAAEDWDAVSWRAESNTGPYAPWRVAVFAADTGDVGEFVGRADTDGSVLSAAVTATATTALVRDTTGAMWALTPPWTETADDFPLDVGCLGQQNRVSSIGPPVLDAFARTVAAGSWGSEPTSGVAYTVSPSGDHAVAAGVGTQTQTSVNSLRTALLALGATDVDWMVDVSLPVASASGATITQWVCGRVTDSSNYYTARLDLSTAGVVSLGLHKRVASVLTVLTAPVTIATGHLANDWWRVYLQIEGTTIRAAAWLTSAAPPSTWQVTATDSSLTSGTQIGVQSRLETGNTNVLPVVVSWDNAKVVNPQRFTFSQRGVNDVAKALPAAAAVSLWAPPVFGK
jgi:hypothetical protein